MKPLLVFHGAWNSKTLASCGCGNTASLPVWTDLRADPRFPALLEKIGVEA